MGHHPTGAIHHLFIPDSIGSEVADPDEIE